MQFGFLGYTALQSQKPGVLDRVCAEAQAVEDAGFDYYSLIEHHQADFDEYSSPLVWLAALAARTRTIKLGATVILPPLYHPIRLAEDAANLDVISGGRLFLAGGVGYQEKDFAAMGVPMRERGQRMNEIMEILPLAWEGKPFSYAGKIFTYKDVKVTPTPVQQPIPFWGGGNAEAAIRRAARLCDGWVVSNNARLRQLEQLAPMYRQEAENAARKPYIALCRNAWVAESMEEAKTVYGEALLKHYRILEQYSGATENTGAQLRDLSDPLGEGINFIVGTPEDCIRQIDFYRDKYGIDALFIRGRTPQGPDETKVLASIRLWGEVIRHYRQQQWH